MQQRKMNKLPFSVLALCVSVLAVLLTNAAGQNNQTNDKVKVLSPGIEVAERANHSAKGHEYHCPLMFDCMSKPATTDGLRKTFLTSKREAKSPITGAIKSPITKCKLMRQEVLTHGRSHKE